MKRYEVGEHTADLELRVWGRSRKELFRNAARGMLEYAAPEFCCGSRICKELHLTASNLEELFIDWLNEILFWLEKEEVLFRRFDIRVLSGRKLEACLEGKKADLIRGEPGPEIKAATYNDLYIKRLPRGWEAHVILDI
jgi:SHS2 domain-containing protein